MVSVPCKGALVETGLTGFDAFNFLMIDYSDGLFCQGCAQQVNRNHCGSASAPKPNIGAQPMGKGMRSATGGGSCYCSRKPLCMGKIMTNGLCDCKGCKSEVSTAVNWLSRII